MTEFDVINENKKKEIVFDFSLYGENPLKMERHKKKKTDFSEYKIDVDISQGKEEIK